MFEYHGMPEVIKIELDRVSSRLLAVYREIFGDKLPTILEEFEQVAEEDAIFSNNEQKDLWKIFNEDGPLTYPYFMTANVFSASKEKIKIVSAPYLEIPSTLHSSHLAYFQDPDFPKWLATYLHEIHHLASFYLQQLPTVSFKAALFEFLPEGRESENIIQYFNDYIEASNELIDYLVLTRLGIDADYWLKRNGDDVYASSLRLRESILGGDNIPERVIDFTENWNHPDKLKKAEGTYPGISNIVLPDSQLFETVEKVRLRNIHNAL
jgi:hypothetical protein